MSNVLHVTVENPDEILNVGAYGAGAIIRIQTSATEAGAYADVSGTGSTPTIAVITGTRAYTGYDPNGISTSWYRTRYENVGATRLSDWSPVFQVGGEEGGLICSLYDVKQRLGITSTDSDEDILDLIRAVTSEVELITGRDFTGARTDVTWREDTRYGSRLWLPRGIQSITTLKVASSDQPDLPSAGTYTTLASTDFALRPVPQERDTDWPATEVWLLSTTSSRFYWAINGAEITGKPGFANVPAFVARLAATAVVNGYVSKGSASERTIIGPDGRITYLKNIEPADYARLMSMAAPAVA